MANERTLLILKAKVSEQAERYDEMIKCMKKVVESGGTLTIEERNLFSVAYKNVVGARRSSWRVLDSIHTKENDERKKGMIVVYQQQISKELHDICNEVLSLIDGYLTKGEVTAESKIFFLKMKGDYLRYLTEVESDERAKDKIADDAEGAYKEAMSVAESELQQAHPVRLGLALNFSVFYYEIKKSPEKAGDIAKQAFDGAMTQLDTMPEDEYKDSALIMQLLRDNLTLWTERDGDEDED